MTYSTCHNLQLPREACFTVGFFRSGPSLDVYIMFYSVSFIPVICSGPSPSDSCRDQTSCPTDTHTGNNGPQGAPHRELWTL